MRKNYFLLLGLLAGALALTLISVESEAQTTGRTVLSASVQNVDFGLIELSSGSTSNTARTRTFDIINNQQNQNVSQGNNQVNFSNVSVTAQLRPQCTAVQVSPTQVTIPPGGRATVTVTLRQISDPGPFACSIAIVSDETLFRQNTSSGGRSTTIHSLSSPFLAVEVLANVAAPRLALSDFRVTRTQRGSQSSTNQQRVVNMSQSGTRSNLQLAADFGSFNVFEEAEMLFRITNNGNANLEINVQATNSRDVTFSGAIGNNIVIAAGQNREVRVRIRPIDGGAISATLTINSTGRNVGSYTQRVTLRIIGTGNTINIVPTPTFLNFEARINVASAASATEQSAQPGSSSAPSAPEAKSSETESVSAQQTLGRDTETLTLRNDGKGDDQATAQIELAIQQTTTRGGGGVTQANSNPFAFENATRNLTLTLTKGDSEQIKINYSPVNPGLDQALIRITVRVANQGTTTSRTGTVIQEFFINLRGVAIASNQVAVAGSSGPLPLSVESAGLQQSGNKETDWVFQAQGQGIASLQAEVYSISGRKIFDSGAVLGKTIRWRPAMATGAALANGIYLYRLTIRGEDGSVERVEIRKFVVLR